VRSRTTFTNSIYVQVFQKLDLVIPTNRANNGLDLRISKRGVNIARPLLKRRVHLARSRNTRQAQVEKHPAAVAIPAQKQLGRVRAARSMAILSLGCGLW